MEQFTVTFKEKITIITNTAVSAVFADFGQAEVPAWMLDPEAEFPEDWSWGDSDGYDFEGIDISFNDDEVASCNKALWLEAINHYCQLKLDKEVVTVRPYNYNYELSERNCSPETLVQLQQPIASPIYQELNEADNS